MMIKLVSLSDLLDSIVFSDWLDVPDDQSSYIDGEFTEGKVFQIETERPVDNGGIR